MQTKPVRPVLLVDTCLLSDPRVLAKFQQEAFYYHNAMRAIHSAPSLILDDELDRDAQDFAVSLAQRKTVEHSQPKDRKGQGENLASECRHAGRVKSGRDCDNCSNDDLYFRVGRQTFCVTFSKSSLFLQR